MKKRSLVTAALLCMMSTTALASEGALSLVVLDEDGSAIEGAQVWIQPQTLYRDRPLFSQESEKISEKDGLFSIKRDAAKDMHVGGIEEADLKRQLIVYTAATDYAASRLTITAEELAEKENVEVRLGKGVAGEIHLVDADGNPYKGTVTLIAHPADQLGETRVDLLSATEQGAGIYGFRMDPALMGTASNHPHTLTLSTEDYTIPLEISLRLSLEDETRVQRITVEEPGSLTISSNKVGRLPVNTLGGEQGLDNSIGLYRVSRNPMGGTTNSPLKYEKLKADQENSLTITGVPPGEYEAKIILGSMYAEMVPHYEGYIFKQNVTIKSGEEQTVSFRIDPASPSEFQGEEIIAIGSLPEEITVDKLRLEGRVENRPPAELPDMLRIENGVLEILGATWERGASYRVIYEGQTLATAAMVRRGPEPSPQIRLNLLPGFAAPEFSERHLDTGEQVSLASLRGKIVYVDFWATWCGPCQEPMQKLSDVWAKRQGDWEGKVVPVAISIDSDEARLRQHIEDKKWGGLMHLFAEQGGGAWQSDVIRNYGVTGIPTAVLINPEGRVEWIGHPGSFPMEERIDAMLAKSGE